jgi:hypothetical protein
LQSLLLLLLLWYLGYSACCCRLLQLLAWTGRSQPLLLALLLRN